MNFRWWDHIWNVESVLVGMKHGATKHAKEINPLPFAALAKQNEYESVAKTRTRHVLMNEVILSKLNRQRALTDSTIACAVQIRSETTSMRSLQPCITLLAHLMG